MQSTDGPVTQRSALRQALSSDIIALSIPAEARADAPLGRQLIQPAERRNAARPPVWLAIQASLYASLNEMFTSLSALGVRRLDPDVFLSDGAVAPPRYRDHPAPVLEFADHAGPLS